VTEGAGAKDIAASAHGVEALRVKGAVVAEPNPDSYSLHPWAAWVPSHPPAPLKTVVYPLPTVYLVALDPVSTFPTANEFEVGVKDATLAEVDPPVELPVEDLAPAVVYPLRSYIETLPATTEPKVAVMVSAPVPDAVAYQMPDS